MKNYGLKVAALSLLMTLPAFADMITVHNHSGAPIYAATYCKVPALSATRTANPVQIAAGASVQMDRGTRSWKCRRELAVATNSANLKALLQHSEFHNAQNLGVISLGTTSGSGSRLATNFYVGKQDNGSLVITHALSELAGAARGFVEQQVQSSPAGDYFGTYQQIREQWQGGQVPNIGQ